MLPLIWPIWPVVFPKVLSFPCGSVRTSCCSALSHIHIQFSTIVMRMTGKFMPHWKPVKETVFFKISCYLLFVRNKDLVITKPSPAKCRRVWNDSFCPLKSTPTNVKPAARNLVCNISQWPFISFSNKLQKSFNHLKSQVFSLLTWSWEGHACIYIISVGFV